MIEDRRHIHELIDRLPAAQLSAVAVLLEAVLDPVYQAVAKAPADDEPVTEEDVRRIREGQVQFAQGQSIPMDRVLAELGLKPEDFPLSK